MAERELPKKPDFSRKRLNMLGKEALGAYEDFLGVSDVVRVVDHGSWSSIAAMTRNYSPPLQEGAALKFFGKEGADFPNGDKLANLFVRLNNIDWLGAMNMGSPLSEERLGKKVDQLVGDLGLEKIYPPRILNDWGDIPSSNTNGIILDRMGTIIKPIRNALRLSEREEPAEIATAALDACVDDAIWHNLNFIIRENIKGHLKNGDIVIDKGFSQMHRRLSEIAFNARSYARFAVASIIAQDVLSEEVKQLPGLQKSNPVEAAFDIYEMGLVPLGAIPERTVNDIKLSPAFRVFEPILISDDI
ncbi:MAG: hypothetical protein AAB531_04315 [Patescibacteria group bacterium]